MDMEKTSSKATEDNYDIFSPQLGILSVKMTEVGDNSHAKLVTTAPDLRLLIGTGVTPEEAVGKLTMLVNRAARPDLFGK